MLHRWLLYALLFSTIIVHSQRIRQRPSANYNKRIDKQTKQLITKPTHIILHYTADCNHSKAYRALSNFFRPVSAHYLIAVDGTVYQLVDESKRAWHAGKSYWRGNTQLNTYSIGIEIVNPGYTKHKQNPCTHNSNLWSQNSSVQIPGSSYHWFAYRPEQIEAVTTLCQNIIKRYGIKPNNILGHSDIAPQRKVDPGPLFPWQTLSQHNIGIWTNDITLSHKTTPIKETQSMLKKLGYKIKMTGKLDKATKKVITAFQMHFRPSSINGIPDSETNSILQNLLEKGTK